jgi:hypothetical protein
MGGRLPAMSAPARGLQRGLVSGCKGSSDSNCEQRDGERATLPIIHLSKSSTHIRAIRPAKGNG